MSFWATQTDNTHVVYSAMFRIHAVPISSNENATTDDLFIVAVVVIRVVSNAWAGVRVCRVCSFRLKLNWNHSVSESTEDEFISFDSFSFGMLKRSLHVRSIKFVDTTKKQKKRRLISEN